MDRTDDYLARAIVYPSDCSISIQDSTNPELGFSSNNPALEVPKVPKWHPLRYTENDEKSGEILVSFSISDEDYNYRIPNHETVDLSTRVEFGEFDCNMLVLGLRALQSPGILPVKKAFIQFNIKSLVPPNASAISNIKT